MEGPDARAVRLNALLEQVGVAVLVHRLSLGPDRLGFLRRGLMPGLSLGVALGFLDGLFGFQLGALLGGERLGALRREGQLSPGP